MAIDFVWIDNGESYIQRTNACPDPEFVYKCDALNLRTRRRCVIPLWSSKDRDLFERKGVIQSRKHCSSCLVHDVDSIHQVPAEERIGFFFMLVENFQEQFFEKLQL
jgi:hypothetical protein